MFYYDKLELAIARIEEELKERLEVLKSENKLIEEQRLRERTNYDIEMLRETGFCNGVENIINKSTSSSMS